jgi:hypothetical protein
MNKKRIFVSTLIVILVICLTISVPGRAQTVPVSHTFLSFDTTTLTGGGAAYSVALDVSSLPPDNYLFFRVVANFRGGTPNSAYSNTIAMRLNNGGSTV